MLKEDLLMDSQHSVPFCSRFPIFLRANGTSGLLLNFQLKTLFSSFGNWLGMLWNMWASNVLVGSVIGVLYF